MEYLIAFAVGGLICAIGQYILDKSTLTPGHVLVLFTVAGGILSGIGLYEPLLKFAKAGALIPVSGFGGAITRGVLLEMKRHGWVGIFSGVFEFTGLGVAAAVVFGFIFALIATPKT